jgi:hypothetical protein
MGVPSARPLAINSQAIHSRPKGSAIGNRHPQIPMASLNPGRRETAASRYIWTTLSPGWVHLTQQGSGDGLTSLALVSEL